MRAARTGRRALHAVIASAVLLVLVVPAVPAAAHHRPQEYVSPTGDLYQSVRKVDGVRRLRIELAAKYFRRYLLCVRTPEGVRTCKRFRVRDLGATFGGSIRWEARFPDGGPGPYTVRWKILPGRDNIGRLLGFHVPA